jgi:hypothetical protein
MFGHDALKHSLSAGSKQVSTIAMEFIAKLNSAIGIISNQFLQQSSTGAECFLSEVLAIEIQQVNAP